MEKERGLDLVVYYFERSLPFQPGGDKTKSVIVDITVRTPMLEWVGWMRDNKERARLGGYSTGYNEKL